MTNNTDLIRKLEKFSTSEVYEYLSIVESANRIINVLGVFFIFLACVFPNVLTVVSLGILVYLLANIGADISQTIDIIEDYIKLKCDK